MQAVDVLGSETMNINMNDVVKQLIENNQEPITSFERLEEEEFLTRFVESNKVWLLREFSEEILPILFNELSLMLTDDLVRCVVSTQTVKMVVSHIKKNGKYTPQEVEKLEYCYVLEWDYEREKEIPPILGEKVVKVELTPSKHNLLIKINNSFPLRGYLPELCEFDYNQQFTAIERLVKNIYSLFVSEMKQTGKPPSTEFLVNRLIKYENLELTDWGEVKKFANIVDVSIDGVDFSAKIEKQFFSAAVAELGVEK